jgi:hypothetical protein
LRTYTRHILRAAVAIVALACAQLASSAPIRILFVGNSYTFGRVDPVMRYNAANVHDLTAAFYRINPAGTNPWEPHPWGGVPGIFKKFTSEMGLDYDVSLSTRNAASLRGHFLNSANADWDLRGNVASQAWDIVVLQEQSDGALPSGRGKNANPLQSRATINAFELFIHDGAARSFSETSLYGSEAACKATGESARQCRRTHAIAANPNANPKARIYLTQTWARPDMVFAHRPTQPDRSSVDGRPKVDPDGAMTTPYYPSLAAMTQDLRDAFEADLAANPRLLKVLPVGDAFQRALDQNLVRNTGFYDANGTAQRQADDLIDLWWDDRLHASKYGSYLAALVQFGAITGIDPLALGAYEKAAAELGIADRDALLLARIASQQLGFRPANTGIEPASVLPGQ